MARVFRRGDAAVSSAGTRCAAAAMAANGPSEVSSRKTKQQQQQQGQQQGQGQHRMQQQMQMQQPPLQQQQQRQQHVQQNGGSSLASVTFAEHQKRQGDGGGDGRGGGVGVGGDGGGGGGTWEFKPFNRWVVLEGETLREARQTEQLAFLELEAIKVGECEGTAHAWALCLAHGCSA